jgi:hypothetical protein
VPASVCMSACKCACNDDDDDDVVHFYSAHIHSIECSGRLADVLACSQKVSHPEMRLVSAAIGASFHFPF